MKKLALGTAQFGLPYGIVNTRGKIDVKEASEILKRAHQAEMNTLDTAITYGESESLLGKIGISHWQVITKIPQIPETDTGIGQWVENAVLASLKKIKTPQLYGVLLHKPSQLLGRFGKEIYAALQEIKKKGLVKKIGISVYTPDELIQISSHFDLDLVQLPFSIFDRRFLHTGWLSKLKHFGVEIHVRSIFLQGLLVTKHCNRPFRFNRWGKLWNDWEQWLAKTGQSPVQACLNFPINQSEIDRIIIGVDSLKHFEEILSSLDRPYTQPPNNLWSDDPDLVNPTRWS